MKHFKLLFSIFLLTFLFSCEKEEIDKLPEITSEGLNTFGCLINGEAFVPKKTTWTDVPLRAEYLTNEDDFVIYTFNSEIILSLKIEIEDPDHPDFSNKFGLFLQYESTEIECEVDNDNSNSLLINYFDFEKKQISGTFNFSNLMDGCNSETKILEGRFDLEFDIY